MLCNFNENCMIRAHFPVPSSFHFLEETGKQMFFRACHCVPIEPPPLFFRSLSFTHVAAFSFGGSQNVDKASVKWDLAGTWTKLAGIVGDVIWKWRPALSTDRRGCQREQGEEVGTAQRCCMIDVSRECARDRTRLSSSSPPPSAAHDCCFPVRDSQSEISPIDAVAAVWHVCNHSHWRDRDTKTQTVVRSKHGSDVAAVREPTVPRIHITAFIRAKAGSRLTCQVTCCAQSSAKA